MKSTMDTFLWGASNMNDTQFYVIYVIYIVEWSNQQLWHMVWEN